MRLRIGSTSLAVVVGLVLAPAAHADGVRTQSGPGATTDDVFVTYVSCGGFFGQAVAPRTRINLGPGVAPMGRRSLGLVPAGTGTAAGPFSRFSSLEGLAAGVSVSATSGTSGVSYIWAITPDVQPGTAWSGRADVSAPAGGWHEVDAAALRYEWSLVDLTTRQPVLKSEQATPAEFAASHGDGRGYVVTGFGCEGGGFNIDAARGQGSTVDFEGIGLDTTIQAPANKAAAGEASVVSGAARDAAGRATGDPLVLETRAPGGEWTRHGRPVLAGPDGVTRVEVHLSETSEVRWYRPESQYADEGWSDTITIAVEPQEPATEPAKPHAEDDKPATEDEVTQ